MLLGTGVWLLAAYLAGASGLMRVARPPLPQILIVALTAALLVFFWAPSVFRLWALSVDPRVLVFIHVSRFIGFDFLVLYRRGELPYDFAVPGGLGDIAVATTAIAVCLFTRPDTRVGRGAVLAWNVFGFLDILFVVATAARLGMADPYSMRALLQLPLSLLPTFLVPMIIATHVIIFERLRRSIR